MLPAPPNARQNQMNPSMAQNLATSLVQTFGGDIAAAVEREFRLGWQLEKVLTRLRQTQIAHEQTPRRMIDGVGQVTMALDPLVYHYWGNRLGYDCWRDKTFRREFARDNPEVRVPVQKKTVITTSGLAARGV